MWNEATNKGQVSFMNQCWTCSNPEELGALIKREVKTCKDDREVKETVAMFLDHPNGERQYIDGVIYVD